MIDTSDVRLIGMAWNHTRGVLPMLAMLPILSLFILAQRYLVSGQTMGRVEG